METTTEETDEYVLECGTRVIKTVITTRVPPVFNLVDESKMTDFERAFITKHNEYRSLHAVPPLQMSRDICDYSQEWADTMARGTKLIRRPPLKNGEKRKYAEMTFSLQCRKGTQLAGDEPVKYWYSTSKDYNAAWYGTEPPTGTFMKCGNYTQLIWKNTQRLGVGVGVHEASNTYFVVANYDPPGNVQTQYKDNVFPPKPLELSKAGAGSLTPPPPIEPTR